MVWALAKNEAIKIATKILTFFILHIDLKFAVPKIKKTIALFFDHRRKYAFFGHQNQSIIR
jgi:hypothetical protein